MEFVYVVDRRDLFDLAFPHGFVGSNPPPGHPDLATYVERIARHGYFVERAFAEQSSFIKQIIPYTLVVHQDRVFVVRRLSQGGESRLHGKRSIGVGGHINPEDDEPAATDGSTPGGTADTGPDAGDRRRLVRRCARRELAEELVIDAPYEITPAGIINDDANPVGSVHFGLVQVARVQTPNVGIRETDTLEGGFLPLPEVKALLTDEEANLETWSSLIIEDLDAVLGA